MAKRSINIEIPTEEINKDFQMEEFIINGHLYLVPKNVEVEVPQIIKDIHKECREYEQTVNKKYEYDKNNPKRYI